MGPIEEHLRYLSDSVRLDAYRRAIANCVKEGFLVADLGCGTGILGLMALQAGASAVHEIDATWMIETARASFSRAGLSGKATFHHAHSARVELQEKVDLVLCDQVGYFGFDAGVVQDFADARRRFLKPGGTLIPSRILLWVAGVESEASFAPIAGWRSEVVPREFRWMRDLAVNGPAPVRLRTSELLTPPVALGEINLHADNDAPFSWHARLSTSRDGVLHGLAGWFECELAEGVWMSNSPLAAAPIQRSQALLPIDEPVRLGAGEDIAVTIVARPGDNLTVWIVELSSGRRYKHSTWMGMPMATGNLVRLDQARVPRLNRTGVARSIILGYCDGRLTARDIELAVLQDHPHLFPSAAETSRFVAHVLAKDTD